MFLHNFKATPAGLQILDQELDFLCRVETYPGIAFQLTADLKEIEHIEDDQGNILSISLPDGRYLERRKIEITDEMGRQMRVGIPVCGYVEAIDVAGCRPAEQKKEKKLWNFTNHSQNDYVEFFSEYGFDEVTAPIHPEITPEMSEEDIVYAVSDVLPDQIEGESFLVQGLSNVVYYAATLIVKNGGTAYYVLTEKTRDENGRFVFEPVELREYADLNKLLGW